MYQLSQILAEHKATSIPSSSEIQVKNKITRGLVKALKEGNSEFIVKVSGAQYANSPEALEAVYIVFKDVLEDEDERYITLNITI